MNACYAAEGPPTLPALPSGPYMLLLVTRLGSEVSAGLCSPAEGSLDSWPSHLWLVVSVPVKSSCLGQRPLWLPSLMSVSFSLAGLLISYCCPFCPGFSWIQDICPFPSWSRNLKRSDFRMNRKPQESCRQDKPGP